MGERAGEFSSDLGVRGAAFGLQGKQFNANLGEAAAQYGGSMRTGTTQWAGTQGINAVDKTSANSLNLADFLANMQLQTGKTQAGADIDSGLDLEQHDRSNDGFRHEHAVGQVVPDEHVREELAGIRASRSTSAVERAANYAPRRTLMPFMNVRSRGHSVAAAADGRPEPHCRPSTGAEDERNEQAMFPLRKQAVELGVEDCSADQAERTRGRSRGA